MWAEIELLAMDDDAKRRLAQILARAQGVRSQRQLAMDLGVALGTVQNWLQGQGFPSSENLEKIAVAAGMSIEELFNQIKGENVSYSPKVAEDVLTIALQLDVEQRRRLIKLLVDNI
ncbi:helix-turn-helix transcriptional regulator [Nostoc linckia]|uniref:helix-turn-helix transcriptional regulator n=1 Tax=Nostoc linckia TaxID=92942 RepID=UPI000BFFA195|nr:helix-turn-helix transcriptional regulator [Nostoc linckia]